MDQEIDSVLNEFEQTETLYGTFKDRALALLIDSLILLPLAAVEWFNKTTWKSQPLLIIVFFIGLLYKPFCELKYGATPGKMSMKLLVVNKCFLKVDFKEVLVRNIFDIIWRIFFFITTLLIFRNPEFVNVSSNHQFLELQKNLIDMNPYLLVYSLLIIIEIIFLLTDKSKRALHDRMGETFVIKQPNNSLINPSVTGK